MPKVQAPKTSFNPPSKGATTSLRKQRLLKEREKYNKAQLSKTSQAKDLRDKRKKEILTEQNQPARKLIRSAGALLSMPTQIRLLDDWMYQMALAAAVIKDIIDFLVTLIEIAVIPYIIIFIATAVVSIFIWGVMQLDSSTNNSGRRSRAKAMIRQSKTMLKGLALATGTIAEFIPVLDVLPLETITVILIYMMVLYERASQAKLDKIYEKAMEMEAPAF